MGKNFVFCRIKLKFRFWLYKKRWHTSWKFQFEKKQVIKKLSPKSFWQTYMKWTVTQNSDKIFIQISHHISSDDWLNRELRFIAQPYYNLYRGYEQLVLEIAVKIEIYGISYWDAVDYCPITPAVKFCTAARQNISCNADADNDLISLCDVDRCSWIEFGARSIDETYNTLIKSTENMIL